MADDWNSGCYDCGFAVVVKAHCSECEKYTDCLFVDNSEWQFGGGAFCRSCIDKAFADKRKRRKVLDRRVCAGIEEDQIGGSIREYYAQYSAETGKRHDEEPPMVKIAGKKRPRTSPTRDYVKYLEWRLKKAERPGIVAALRAALDVWLRRDCGVRLTAGEWKMLDVRFKRIVGRLLPDPERYFRAGHNNAMERIFS